MSMPTIHTLDLMYLGEGRSIASYLLVGRDGPVLIETGPGSTFEQLVSALAAHGYSPLDVKHALVTHIHFDHAGAAGLLAQHGTTIHVHEFGAQHLIDPSKLIASATRIYGDDMDRLWGRIVPIAESQVVPLRDGDVFDEQGIQLTAIETPGHARHHHAFAMETDEGTICFTGDAAAMVVPDIPGTQYISLPTPPPEFDQQAWLESIDRLASHHFTALYLTHFGCVRNVQAHLDAVADAVNAHAAFIINAMKQGHDEASILSDYSEWVRTQASDAGMTPAQESHFVSSNLLSMNVTGIMRYQSKRTAQ